MSLSIVHLIVFFAIGVLWNVYPLMSLDAAVLRRSLTALLFSVLIPAYAILWLWQAPLNLTLLKFVFIGIISLMVNFLVVWYLLKNKRWPDSVKGSIIIALSFSAVFTHGMPMIANIVGAWSAKLALQMLVLVVMPLAFTLGTFIAHRYAERRQAVPGRNFILKQPLFWLTLAGLLLNVGNIQPPLWIKGSLQQLVSGIVPLMLLTAGLAMKWQSNWTRVAIKVWPYILIPALITPLTLWASVTLLGGFGPKTLTAMLMLAIMPSSLLGFYICEQFRLELASYNIIYTLSVALSIILIPLVYWLVSSGLIHP